MQPIEKSVPIANYTRRSSNADCTACRVWNAKCASFVLGVGAFRA